MPSRQREVLGIAAARYARAAMASELRCGIVGPARSRNGLGPFLARFAEGAGLRVVAAAGRDSERTAAACASLAAALGHAVAPHASLAAMLAAERLDALIVATPALAHRAALELALAHGCAVLCEKPLVAPHECAAIEPLLDDFLARGLALVENCQWPFTLPAFRALWPGLAPSPRSFAMGLSPAERGPAMLEDSLSHFVSLAQAIVPIDARSAVRVPTPARIAAADPTAVLECEFVAERSVLCGRLELRVVERQPRPAWYSIDGHRVDRAIELPGYRLAFETADGRREGFEDPMRDLVYGFAALVRSPALDRIRAESESIRHRARLYHAILDACRRAAR